MDVASMIAINNRNMITMMNALQEVNHIVHQFTTFINECPFAE